MDKCSFSRQHYREILRYLRNAGFSFVNYDQYVNGNFLNSEKLVILRHDLDQSLRYAEHIAQIEYEEKTRSTFFVWMTSPFYNVLDPEQLKLIRRIIQLEHDIGLHFDPTAYPDSTDLIKEKITMERDLLSTVIGRKISAFSFHRPTANMLMQDCKIDGLINSYDPVFFGDFKYVSDSNHHWREGCVCNHISKHPKLHVLTHPVWWSLDHHSSPIEKLHQFQKDLGTYTFQELIRNVKAFKTFYTKDED